jgi:hypothetical protein
MNRDIDVKFIGFQPSEAALQHIHEMLDEVWEEAPYGANIRLSLNRQKHVFKGVIQIASSAGPFFATASGEGLKLVSEKLRDRIHRRLEKWKSQRFRRRSLKLLPSIYDSSKSMDGKNESDFAYRHDQESPHDSSGLPGVYRQAR